MSLQSTSDDDLLKRSLAGDEEAFTILYRRRQGAVYRFALHMSGSPEAAEEITQETFVAMLQFGSRFDPARGVFTSFLLGIARNLMLRRRKKERASEDVEFEEPVAADDPLEEYSRRETVDAVRKAVASLPLGYREAVVLCDLEEVSYESAAEIIGCPLGTVRSRVSRGRSMLAMKLRNTLAIVAGGCL